MSILLVQPYRFTFRCEDPVYFPAGKLTNHLRGAFGLIFRRMACAPECQSAETCSQAQTCAYARIFAPRVADECGPADMVDLPRSFVLRPQTLNELRLNPGETFTIDLHLFDLSQPCLRYFILALSELAEEGLGAGRPRVCLESVARLGMDGSLQGVVFDKQGIRSDAERQSISLSLDPPTVSVSRLLLSFHTPTELKHRGALLREPHFPAIMVRTWDRIKVMRWLYQSANPDRDFGRLAELARTVRLVHSTTEQVSSNRRSLRTGINQTLIGFIGYAEYEGDLTELVPYLRAAYWTGIGRQTVWGHGAIQVQSVPSTSPRR